MKMTQAKVLHAFVLLGLLGPLAIGSSSAKADEPWLSHYPGSISWEMEMAHLDNFSIQVMNDPSLIGYILVYSGYDSCRRDAQARALRMKNYMIGVRGLPWNKVMWRDGGRYRGKGLEIFLLGIPKDKLDGTTFLYEPPARGQLIRECKRKKSG